MCGRVRGFSQPHRPGARRDGARIALAGGFLVCAIAVPLLAAPPRHHVDAAVIPIRGEISNILRDSIKRRMDAALADGAKTIVFEMDTPGGLVTSALDICRMIKNAPEDVRTIAWVHHEAYSAGAMISVACKQILMSSASSSGDCAPILLSPTGGLEEMPKTERAKAESPVLQEFRDSATRNGYNQLLLRAMVTIGDEVWWVQNSESGERKFVTTDEKTKLIDDAKDGEPKWRLVETYTDPLSKRDVAAKEPINSATELLTLSQSEAVAYSIATGIANDLDAVTEKLNISSAPLYLDITGWEKFVMWLNSPLVRGILFAIVLIGAYMEFQHPGLILPGVTAAVALTIFLAAPYAAGLAAAWTFVLLAIGLILLAVEIFLVPGHGVSGVIGVALILIAVIGTFVPPEPAPNPSNPPFFTWPQMPGTWDALQTGIIYLCGSITVALVGILLILRFLPQLPISRGVVAPNPDGAAMALHDPFAHTALVGDVGIVTGDLRPGGQARFGQEVVDVQSQGEYVEAGRRVQVLRHEGMTIVVRPLPDESRSA